MRNQLLGNRYRILSLIGEGGMASVYKAVDTKLDRRVAVKVLHAHLTQNEDIRHRFQQEAKALSGIEHPNIIKIYDFSGAESEQLWIVTEILKGVTLAEFTRGFPRASLHPVLAAIIIQEVCKALAQAHSQGIIHRDIKPENIMVLDDGHLKLMDFGIAKDIHKSNMTMTGTFMGSPSYMSPEQIRGRDIDHRSDIYSLSVMFYEIITGVLPFTGGSTADVINKIIIGQYVEPKSIISNLPHDINHVIVRSMQSDPARRFQTVDDIVMALAAFCQRSGFMESHIELERFYKDRRSFEQRLLKLPEPRATLSTSYDEQANNIGLAATEIIAAPTEKLASRTTATFEEGRTAVGSRGPTHAPRPVSRVARGSHRAPTQVSGGRRGTRSAFRPTMTENMLGMMIVGIAIIGLFAGFLSLSRRMPENLPEPPAEPFDAEPITEETPAAQPATEAETDKDEPEAPAQVERPKPAEQPTPARNRPPLRRPLPTATRPTPKPAPAKEPDRSAPVAAPRRPVPPPAEALPPPPAQRPRAVSGFGQLTISAQPAAEIIVNGRPMGTTNDPDVYRRGLRLKAGRHLVELKRRGYATVSRYVVVESDETKSLNVKMERDVRGVRLTVTSNLVPAKVMIEESGGNYLRRELNIMQSSVGTMLPPGLYKVRVEYGNQLIERTVNVQPQREGLTFNAEFKRED